MKGEVVWGGGWGGGVDAVVEKITTDIFCERVCVGVQVLFFVLERGGGKAQVEMASEQLW